MSIARIWCLCTLLLWVAPAPSQQPPAPRTPHDRLRTGLPPSYYHSLAREIDRSIPLSDEQLQALALLADQHQRSNIALRRTMRQLRQALAELRAAEPAGDAAQLTSLRRQIATLRGQVRAASDEGDPFSNFFGDIDLILTPEQKPALAGFQATFLEDRLLGSRVRSLLDALPQTLTLQQDQQALYDRLRAQLRESATAPRFAAADPADVEDAIFRAEDSGDFDVSDRFRANAVAIGPNPRKALEDVLGGLEPALDAEQKRKLVQFRQDLLDPIHARQLGVRTLLRTARQLTLSTDQEEKLRTLEAEQSRKARAMSNNAESLAALSLQTQEKITAILTAEQRQQFAALLAHARPAKEGEPGD